jgi:hypothetical protein
MPDDPSAEGKCSNGPLEKERLELISTSRELNPAIFQQYKIMRKYLSAISPDSIPTTTTRTDGTGGSSK